MDPYVDSNGVLKNKLNLKTEKELEGYKFL